MSEDSNDFKFIKNKPRSKKRNPRVDLTAMISVSFLLIIFFMVTKELARPQAMDLGLPSKSKTSCGRVVDEGCGPKQQRIITLLLDDNNKVISYRGLLEVPENGPKISNYGKDGIRKELIIMRDQVKEYMSTRNHSSGDGAIVIIKPSKKSSYGNLVDILDEMAITQIPTYAIVSDISPDEKKLLSSN